MRKHAAITIVALVVALAGCETTPPDYSNFRARRPRSILVLPPLNETVRLEAGYGYLSTLTQPLAERGYYVFPVAVVDQMLKENGLPTAGEMHEISLAKVAEVTGADAVLYPTIKQYSSSNYIVAYSTVVEVAAKLVDTRTQTLLWSGHARVERSARQPEEAVLEAIVRAVSGITPRDELDVSEEVNEDLFADEETGLLYGPYSPRYDAAP